jgi:hypothetical protein
MDTLEEIVAAPTTSMIDPAYCYGEAEHRHFIEFGYCTFPKFLSPAGLAACQFQILRMLERLQPGRQPDEIISAHVRDRWIWELATQAPVLDMIERQIGPNILLWSSALVCKPPGAGRVIPWHQDAPYWNLTGKLAAGLWIPFDDVDASNGAMCILPGWHSKGELPRKKSADSLFTYEIDPLVLPVDLDQIKYQYNLPAGGLAIHDTMMPHNSLPNGSNRWRRVLVLRYMSADGTVGAKQYEDYVTGKTFEREAFLVRGEDLAHRGYRRSPLSS